MDVREYNNQIDEIKTRVESTKEYAKMFDDGVTLGKLEQLSGMIREDRFQLIVVGEFSRGKSMLVNAIIGKKLLPSSKNPTTATLNIIEDGTDIPEYCVFYHDGTKKDLSGEEFLELVAPDGRDIKPTEINKFYSESTKLQQIHHVRIKVDNRMGKNGITIVDTPGVNDVDERREQITYKFIPNADAALIVCSSTQQLSKSEMVFLKENILKNDIGKLFIVSNFKDMLSNEEECEKVKAHFVTNLEGIVHPDRIILVSAKEALRHKRFQNGEQIKKPHGSYEETGFEELESRLYDFLINERGTIKVERYKAILKKCSEELAYGPIERRLDALKLTTMELELKIQTLRPEIQQIKMRCDNRLSEIHSKLVVEGRSFSKEYRNLQDTLYRKAKDAVCRCESDIPEEVFAYMEESINECEKELYAGFPERMKDKMIEIMRDSLDKMGDEFGIVGIQLDFGFDDLQNTACIGTIKNELTKGNIPSTEATSGEIIGTAVTVAAGVVGLVAAVSLGGLALPFAHVGLRLLSGLGTKITDSIDGVTDANRQKVQLTRVLLAEVEKRFHAPIDNNVAAFEEQYKSNLNVCLDRIKNECYERLEQTINELNAQLEEKMSAAVESEEERKRLMEIKKLLLAV
ncbi:Dynamin family protein [Lachnospiraceae bacterium KHCPX20]|nr:Dynamin family protein [Lachnospiraceae bacterium KHCPX20]